MNIANGTAAAISLQSPTKKTDGKAKTEAFLGKVIAKSGKEIQVLINDKVYKIEPGNAQNIKIGDKIQVYFGSNIPQEISEEMLKKISGKLIDVFSLSLPYKTTKELESLINQMPQSERLQFAKISNDMVQMIESIIKEEYSIQSEKASIENKNTFNLFDHNLPYNRRLVELSLKAKEMGKAWEQIPNEIKREIIKKYVLFDLQKQSKGNQSSTLGVKSNVNYMDKEAASLESTRMSTNIKDSQAMQQKDLNFETKNTDFDIKESNRETPNKDELINKSQTKKPIINSQIDKTLEQKGEKSTNFSEKANLLSQKIQSSKTADVKIMFQKKETNPESTENSQFKNKNTNYETNHNTRSETNKTSLNQNQISKNNNPNIETRTVHSSDKLEQTSQSHTQSKRASLTNHLEYINTHKNHDVSFSKEDIRLITTILQKSNSKPLSLEENLQNLNKLNESGNDSKMNIETLQNKGEQKQLTKDSENILQLIKTLSSFEKTTNTSSLTTFSERKINFIEFSSNYTFEKITHSPLMNLEIKNMINSFKSFGIPENEANQTTLDIVNIATRTLKEENISTQLYSLALKKYLKVKLPQLIVNHKIDQNNESELINKIESFSKKVFVIIKAFSERLMSSRETQINQTPSKGVEKEEVMNQSSEVKKPFNRQNSQEISQKQTHKLIAHDSEKLADFKANPEKAMKGLTPRTPFIPKKATMSDSLNIKKEEGQIQSNLGTDKQKVLPNENRLPIETKALEQIQKNEYSSEKLIKFLNITSEKTDFSNPYSSLISLNEQPFVIDFHHQKMDKGGYEKNEMYRVFIETNTQLFGTVFVDTVVSNKKIDIYIYAQEQYAKAFTNHSSTLIKRIKETDYDLRGLFVREKLDQNGILKLKVKQYTNPKKEGGFHSLA